MSAQARRLAAYAAAAVVGLMLGAFLFAWSGIYNIAASRGHWAAVEWVLQFGMKNSVKRRAWTIEEPPLDDPALSTLGAGHFHRACAHCHGAPGIPADLTAQQALPPPPDLNHTSQEWRPRELFWIVKHGIKYTGMPAWIGQERDDEVWAVVAFLQRLPTLNSESYSQLIGGARPLQGGRDIAIFGPLSQLVGACAGCHGAEQQGPASGLVPVLHGQPAEFLASALHAYAKGVRLSGFMQPVAAELRADEIVKLADYYAGLAAPGRSSRAEPLGSAARSLANEGDPNSKIPACIACHQGNALPTYPRLAGQNAAYMAHRLRRWKDGLQPTSDAETIMAPIARLLSDQQIVEISNYFASAPREDRGRAR